MANKTIEKILVAITIAAIIFIPMLPEANATSFSVSYTITDLANWASGIVPIADSYQREMVEYNGRTWFWYYNQTAVKLGYSSTTDGVNFQPFYAIGDTRPYRISVDDDENGNMYLAWTNGTANIPVYFMCGAMNVTDGTVSWNSSFQAAVPAEVGITFTRANIQLDSAGYPYIGYQRWNDSYSEVCLTKSKWNNGTWETDTGFPISVSPASTVAYRVLPKKLPNQKMLIFYGYALTYLYSRYWNGSGLEDVVQVSSKTMYGGTLTEFSAVTVSDQVLIGYLSNEVAQKFYFLTYDSVTKTYSSESVVTSFPESSCGITLTYDYSNSALYFFAGNYSSDISQRCVTLSIYKNEEWHLKDERLYEEVRYNGKMLSSETVNNTGKIVVLAFPYSPNAAPVLFSVTVSTYYSLEISTSQTGLVIYVNGTEYTTPASITADSGALLVIEAPNQTKGFVNVKYYFSNWEDSSTNGTREITLTGDTAITAYFTYTDPRSGYYTILPIMGGGLAIGMLLLVFAIIKSRGEGSTQILILPIMFMFALILIYYYITIMAGL